MGADKKAIPDGKISIANIRGLIFALFAVYSALIMGVCSMTSFIFPLHDRVDQNVFFTVGREILNGKVIYRDMFEHKGPLTYFIHALAALISRSSFIGVYMIEVVFYTVFLHYVYRTLLLFTGKTQSFCAALVTGAVIASAPCFQRGDNVEELCLSFIMIPLYHMLRSYRLPSNDTPVPQGVRISFLNGIMFGAVLWIKFNLVGFWIGWMLAVYIPLLKNRRYGLFFRHAAAFASAFLITSVPWVVYFIYKNSFYDFVYTYFYCNIFLYKDSSALWVRIVSVLMGMGRNLIGNVTLLAVSFYGLIRLCKKHIYAPLITYIFLYAGVFFGGRWYEYYYLIFACYFVPGVAYFVHDISKTSFYTKIDRRALVSLCALFCFIFSVVCSNCARFYFRDESEYPQVKFASYIKNSGIESPTLLNYGFIDQGFYLASGISPVNKYFCRVNIPYSALPEMYDEQKRLIDNGSVDFVVVRMNGSGHDIENEYMRSLTGGDTDVVFQNPLYTVDEGETPLLFENYDLIMSAEDISSEYTFGLFQKKDAAR